MLDSGCTRSCVRKDEKFISSNIQNSDLKIKCANNEIMDAAGTCEIKPKFSQSFQPTLNPLIIANLSCPFILGLDIIQSLEYDIKSKFVKVNGHKLRLIDGFDKSKVCYLNKAVTVEPYQEIMIPCKNLFECHDKDANILVNNLHKQNAGDNITITPAIYKNEERINVLVTNRTHKRIHLRKRKPLCTMEISQLESCNGVKFLENSQEENKMVNDFQNKRLEKANKINFEPKIGSFGDLCENQKSEVNDLIQKNRLAFNMDSYDLGRLGHFHFTLPQHDETETAYQPPRAIPIHQRPKVDEELAKWKEMGIIEETQSANNIPIIVLKKGDGSIRISLDARELNTKLKADRFPLPHMSTIFSKIGEKLSTGKECWISTFDLHRGYWQVRVSPEDKHKVAFSYDNKHYAANRMLYGTSTSPSAFSRIMMKLFGDHSSFLLYLDDIIVLDSSYEEHLKSLSFLFEKCQKYGLLLSAKKAHICKSEIEFLGHKFSKEGIFPLDRHKTAVKEFPQPTDKQSTKRFLGLVNYNLRFIEGASVTLRPLYDICSSKVSFIWDKQQEQAFEKIKKDLLNSKGLKHRNPKLNMVLVSDASKDQVGSTLYQINGDNYEVIGYFSKSLSGPDSRRPMRVKELLALTYSIRHFEFYLLNATFTCITDHKSLLYLYREHLRTNLDAKLTNIFFYLQNFDFKIAHASGNSPIMASADCLSRIKTTSFHEISELFDRNEIPDRLFSLTHFPGQNEGQNKMRIFLRALAHGNENLQDENESQNDLEEKSKVVFQFEDYKFTRDSLIKSQNDCPDVKNIRVKLGKFAKKTSKNFQLIDGILFNTKKASPRIVLPSSTGNEFLSYLHASYGHCGANLLNVLANKYVFITKSAEKANTICRRCLDCLRSKPRKALRPSLIQKRYYEAVPFSKTHIDLFDLGKIDNQGKRYLVTFVCSLTGFIEGIPIATKTDVNVSKALTTIILRHGLTNICVTDNGREFGERFSEILEKFRILHVKTAAYQSRSNGVVERCHREIVSKMKLLDTNRRNWSTKWPYIQYLLNNIPRTSLDGLSSSEALYGRPLHVPFELISPIENQTEPYIKALNEYLSDIHPSLMAFQYRKYSDFIKSDTGNAPILKIGSKALIWKPDISEGKLSKCWAGPYVIKRRLSKDTYLLHCDTEKKNFRRHVRHLRPLASPTTSPLPEPEPENLESQPEIATRDEFENNFKFPFAEFPES